MDNIQLRCETLYPTQKLKSIGGVVSTLFKVITHLTPKRCGTNTLTLLHVQRCGTNTLTKEIKSKSYQTPNFNSPLRKMCANQPLDSHQVSLAESNSLQERNGELLQITMGKLMFRKRYM